MNSLYKLTPIVALFFAAALGVTAATTIGTDISTTGTFTASTTDAGSDITLKAMDEVLVRGINVLFDLNDGEGGIFRIDGDGASSDYIQFTPADDNLTFQLDREGSNSNVYVEWEAGNTPSMSFQTTAPVGGESLIELVAGSGDWGEVSLSAVGEVSVNAAAGGQEINVRENSVTTGTATIFYPAKAATPPTACDAGVAGGFYYDTSINEPCYCNGSAWTAFDGAGSCS